MDTDIAHTRLASGMAVSIGQNTVVGFMRCSFWLCVEACQEEYVGIPIFTTRALLHDGSGQRYPEMSGWNYPDITAEVKNNEVVRIIWPRGGETFIFGATIPRRRASGHDAEGTVFQVRVER